MATEDTNSQLSVSVAPDAVNSTVTVDSKGVVGKSSSSGDSYTINTADEAIEKELDGVSNEDGDEVTDPPAADADKPAGDTPEETPAADDAGEPLPDYDPASEESRAAYDAKYVHEVDGKPQLNLNAFNDELEANIAAGTVDINKGSREWLKDTFGVDDEAITIYLKGRVAEVGERNAALAASAGGEEALDAMLTWGREGGYSKEQVSEFNAALAKGGDAAADAVAILKSRFERAGQKAPASQGKPSVPQIGLRNRRPSSPARQANGSNAPAPKVEGFKDSEEHRHAMLEAGDDASKVAAVRAKLKASSWFNK